MYKSCVVQISQSVSIACVSMLNVQVCTFSDCLCTVYFYYVQLPVR